MDDTTDGAGKGSGYAGEQDEISEMTMTNWKSGMLLKKDWTEQGWTKPPAADMWDGDHLGQ